MGLAAQPRPKNTAGYEVERGSRYRVIERPEQARLFFLTRQFSRQQKPEPRKGAAAFQGHMAPPAVKITITAEHALALFYALLAQALGPREHQGLEEPHSFAVVSACVGYGALSC